MSTNVNEKHKVNPRKTLKISFQSTSYINSNGMAQKIPVYSIYVNGGPDVRVFPKEY